MQINRQNVPVKPGASSIVRQKSAPAFWDRLGAWVALEVPSLLVPSLNIAAYLSLASIGVRIRDNRNRDAVDAVRVPQCSSSPA